MCAWRKCPLEAWLREANWPVLRHSVVFHSLRHYGLWSLSDTSVLGISHETPGRNTGVGSDFLLQWIFPTQGWNLNLLHCRWILYCWATLEVQKGNSLLPKQNNNNNKRKRLTTKRIGGLVTFVDMESPMEIKWLVWDFESSAEAW